MRSVRRKLFRFACACTAAVAFIASAYSAESSAPPDQKQTGLASLTPEGEFETYLLAHPENAAGLAEQANNLVHLSTAAPPEEAQRLRKRARVFAAAAIQAGSENLFMTAIVSGITEQGDPVPDVYSSHTQANALVAAGEKKFEKADYDGALADYQAAWRLDPTSGKIALYIGDAYFVQKDNAKAIEWFDRAIALEPFMETAHRYRGDALMRLRRVDEAGESYIAAVIADPYGRIPRGTLRQWAAQVRRPFRNVARFPQATVTAKDGKFELGVAPDVDALSLAYGAARIKFAEEHQRGPNSYRHQLDEERQALELTLQVAAELRAKPDAAKSIASAENQIALLQRIADAGLLEPHILLDRADADLARDYAAFRAAHRAQLRRYIGEFWLSDK